MRKGGRGIVIGQTKDDITGMIMAIHWKRSTGCAEIYDDIALYPHMQLGPEVGNTNNDYNKSK